MRLGILDVGSNTVHLLVVDAEPGAQPVPAADVGWDSPLLEHLDADNKLSDQGLRDLLCIIDEARQRADALGVADFSAFATSALRDADNGEEVLARVEDETGIDVNVLGGDDEARLTFLAVRRWYGWSSGRLLVVDIGGGSLELAVGSDETPEHVASLPLGARRLTRERLRSDPPSAKQVAALRDHVSAAVAARLRPFRAGEVDHAVGTSKTLRSLARIAGAAPLSDGPYVRRVLCVEDTANLVDKLAGLSARERAKLPGVSARRAPQLLAGAIVAATTMALLDVDELLICPWALREGVFLTRQDWIVAL